MTESQPLKSLIIRRSPSEIFKSSRKRAEGPIQGSFNYRQIDESSPLTNAYAMVWLTRRCSGYGGCSNIGARLMASLTCFAFATNIAAGVNRPNRAIMRVIPTMACNERILLESP